MRMGLGLPWWAWTKRGRGIGILPGPLIDFCESALAARRVPDLPKGMPRGTCLPALPPAAMHPQPLPRMLAPPALDDAVHQRGRRRHVNPALGIARQLDRLGQLQPEAAIGLADGAGAMHRAVE